MDSGPNIKNCNTVDTDSSLNIKTTFIFFGLLVYPCPQIVWYSVYCYGDIDFVYLLKDDGVVFK